MKLHVSTHHGELILDNLPSDATGWDLKQKLHAQFKDEAHVPPAAEQALVRFHELRKAPHVLCCTQEPDWLLRVRNSTVC